VIAALWARASGWLVAVGAVLAALAAAWWAGRRAGTAGARTRALEAEIRTRETRDAVERDVARVPDPAGQLRERWSRD
jgi:Flp pilus assembly protein TadB